jgi:hypothetical protein
VRAVPRKLTATTVVALAVALGTAGCGKNDSGSTSAAQNATTTPAVATATTPATGSKTSKTTGSKVSKATDAQTPAKSKTSGSKTTKSTTTPKAKTTAKKTATKPKVATTKSPLPAVTPKSSGSDLTSGSGSGPIVEREDVVAVLRRYYKGFIDKDGAVVCSLLTSEGRKTMISDGNGKNCEESVKKLVSSASPDNVALLQRTRDGLHADDVKVTGNNATAQIGKTSSLRLVQENGAWLLRSPDVVVSKS